MNLDRIRTSIDVDAMQNSHVTFVGGCYGIAHDLVRSGLGACTLIDFASVSETNPSRQDLLTTDIGLPKVEAVANSLKKVNPELEVEILTQDFCEMSAGEVETRIGGTSLLVNAPDQFPPNARANLISQLYGIPSLWIGLYAGARAGEIVYSIPGLTDACYRCICKDRYGAFARGATSPSSQGGTIHDIHLVDAIAGHLAAGILTRGAENRFGQLIEKLGNRNLLQVKIDPDYRLGSRDIFTEYLGSHEANFSFTTIALPMERDPSCPDCAATWARRQRDADDPQEVLH